MPESRLRSAPVSLSEPSIRSKIRAVVMVSSGNFVEMYDFMIYVSRWSPARGFNVSLSFQYVVSGFSRTVTGPPKGGHYDSLTSA
jgi:hypothetical protein